jgi:hypothetical protein
VDQDVTGGIFDSVDALVNGLPGVLALDRAAVRRRAIERFGVARMVDEYVTIYERLRAN